VLATKVGRKPDRQGLSRDNIRAAVAESLERLQSDYIDLYYAHADDPDTACVPYSALARGFLTGKSCARSRGRQPARGAASQYLQDERALAVLGALDRIAEADTTTMAAAALAWVRSQPGVSAPV